jgi:PAS domain S-box-containing protein
MVFDAADLQRALDHDQFFPVFQPIVELRTGQLTGFELLARWHHPSGATIPPDQFIPLIESSGLISPFTRSLLTKAFASSPLVNSSLHLSVNLSPLQLQDLDLPERVAASLRQGAFSPDRLIFEVTESALLHDVARARAVAIELKKLGCRLALDDFGTGYSSLRHLEALPFDKLKIDSRFVRSMTQARDSRKIVAAVIGLGQSLGLITIAEGVETPAQAAMLLWLGCDFGQGWLYGKPAPAHDIPRMISTPANPPAVHMFPVAVDVASVGLDALPSQRLAQLEAIYDGAPVGLCFLDRNMRYVSINRRLAEMNGAPISAHIGNSVADVIPHMFPLIEPHIRQALAGQPVTGVELDKPIPDAGSQSQTVLLSYHPARDEAGEVVGISVAVVDITQHKRTEAALNESLAHFRHIMELGPHIPWVLNQNGEVVEASSRWEDITGQPLAEAMGQGWLRMLHPGDIPATTEAIHHALVSGQSIDLHFRVRTPDGQWLPMRSRGGVRFNHSGEIIAVYGVLEEAPLHQPHSPEFHTSGVR